MSFNARYTELVQDILQELGKKVLEAKTQSTFGDFPAIKVDVFDYVELAIVDQKLVFIDSKGLYYSKDADCSIGDFIDILNEDYVQ